METNLLDPQAKLDISDFHAYAVEQNLTRIKYASIVMLLYHVSSILRVWGMFCILDTRALIGAIISVLYFLLVFFFSATLFGNLFIARLVYISYWSISALCMVPYFISDVTITSTPVNMILFGSALIIIPVFDKRDIFCAFGAYAAMHTVIAIVYNASIWHYVDIFVFCATAIMMSYFIQYRYVNAIARLSAESRIDPLTGVMNKKGGMDKMETVLELCKRHNEKLAVYMIDIDNFKSYNDTFGHIQGDTALKLVAVCIEKVFSRSSDVVCRFGGEEFVVCASVDDLAIAGIMAEKLIVSVLDSTLPVAIGKTDDYLTISVGYTLFDGSRDSNDTKGVSLVELADAALYQAKNSGKNRSVLYI